MQLALDLGPNLSSTWAHERRWHGPAAALMVHVAVAMLCLSWPAAQPPALDDQVIELVLAPQPQSETFQPEVKAAPPPPTPVAEPAPVKPVTVKPAPIKPTAGKPAATKPSVIAKAAPVPADTSIAEPTPAAAAANTTSAPGTEATAAPASTTHTSTAPPVAAQGEADLKPNPTESPRPFYPRAARQRGWQGVVTVLVHVAENGMPLEVAVKESSGHSVLDEAAVDAVKRWRFTPARHGGRPVTAAVEVPVRFSLEG